MLHFPLVRNSIVSLLIIWCFSTFPALAQNAAEPSATAPVTTVVTVLGEKYTPPPAVSKSDVLVLQNGKKITVTDWVPAQGDKALLELAILIDDAVTPDFAIQLNDLRSFITSQPPTTAVAVFYASNGTVQAASQFSTNHEAVAKSVRIPLGYWGAYSSIYFSLQDLIKRWPVTPGARREILLIGDGIDRFHGDYPVTVDLDPTIAKAQTAGIVIHSLFATGVGHVGHSLFRINLGQSNLSRMTDATGGHAFFQGLQTPVSIAPFLDQLNVVLKNQYWLTLAATPGKKGKGGLQRIRVGSELKDLDIDAPTSVFVPPM
jgi:hypothetical protein